MKKASFSRDFISFSRWHFFFLIKGQSTYFVGGNYVGKDFD